MTTLYVFIWIIAMGSLVCSLSSEDPCKSDEHELTKDTSGWTFHFKTEINDNIKVIPYMCKKCNIVKWMQEK